MEIDDVIAVDVAPGLASGPGLGQGPGLAPGPGLGQGPGLAPGQGLGDGEGEDVLSVAVLVSGRWHGEMDLSTRGGDDQEGQDAVAGEKGRAWRFD